VGDIRVPPTTARPRLSHRSQPHNDSQQEVPAWQDVISGTPKTPRARSARATRPLGKAIHVGLNNEVSGAPRGTRPRREAAARDRRRWADGRRRRPVTGCIRRDAAREAREQRMHLSTAFQVGPNNEVSGAPRGTRTPNLLVRSQMLYPIELSAQLKERHSATRSFAAQAEGRLRKSEFHPPFTTKTPRTQRIHEECLLTFALEYAAGTPAPGHKTPPALGNPRRGVGWLGVDVGFRGWGGGGGKFIDELLSGVPAAFVRPRRRAQGRA
jgi:hypothetical protein